MVRWLPLLLALGCTPFEDLEAFHFADVGARPADGQADQALDAAAKDAAKDAAEQPDSATDAAPDLALDAQAEAGADSKVDAEVDAHADAHADAVPDAPDAEADAEPDAEDDPDAEDTGPDAARDLGPDAGQDAGPDADNCQPVDEICDGLDNDCDEAIDEEPVDVGEPCVVRGEGECQASGHTVCVGEESVCDAVVGPEAEEACDGFDNDCDGVADEGFDLLTDEEHCGACGRSCGEPASATATCQGGRCFIERCDDHRFDVDGEYGTGCEAEAPGAEAPRIIVVSAEAEGEELGTVLAPFQRIQSALLVAREGDIVDVLPGRYEGPLDVDLDYLTVRGREREARVVGGITIRGDHTRVESLTISGGDVGVSLLCGAGCGVVDNAIQRIGRSEVYAEGRYGVRIITGDRHVVHDNDISLVMGGRGGLLPEGPCVTRAGGSAAGVRLDAAAQSSRVTANTIGVIRGGAGGGALDCMGVCDALPGAEGGAAFGIELADAEDVTVAGNSILDVEGGLGGNGHDFGIGGTGGLAAGVRLAGANNRLFGNRLDLIRGGAGGVGGFLGPGAAPGAPGAGFGVHLRAATIGRMEPSLDHLITESNLVDGEPIIYRFDEAGVRIEGRTLTGGSNPTNLGKIVLIGCDGAEIRDNEVANFIGETGHTGTAFRDVFPGGRGVGILVADSAEVLITGNEVRDIEGGRGGGGATSVEICGRHASGASGGPGAGVQLIDVTRSTLLDNTLGLIRGGQGGTGAHSGGPGGAGGRAQGIALLRSTGNTFADNTFSLLTGGDGGPGGFGPDPLGGRNMQGANGPAGAAFAFHLDRLDEAGPSLDNSIAESNTVDEEAILYVNRQDGRRIIGQEVTTSTHPTNLGRVAVLDSTGVVLEGNVLRGAFGHPGATGSFSGFAGEGDIQVGIFAERSPGLELIGNTVSLIQGGPGGHAGVGVNGMPGSRGVGIQLSDAPDARLQGNTIFEISPGEGGAAGQRLGGLVGTPGPAGEAIGVLVRRSAGLSSRNDLVYQISAGWYAAGFRVGREPEEEEAPRQIIEIHNATIHGITSLKAPKGEEINISLPQAAYGIHADRDGVANVWSTIIDEVTDVGALAGGGGGGSLSYCNVWATPEALEGFLDVEPGTISVDPQFLDAARDDFGLSPESLCVDAGDPVADCSNEPDDGEGGCRIDQGHVGNTGRARAR